MSYTDEGENSGGKTGKSSSKASNVLPLWGNERTMNLNNLILTNIQSSHYFKVNLYELKTYHEVVDEIYYKVQHLEPWEKGSRRTSGQTGMCGGVRGVGAGGIVSTAYCLLYKLFTLKLTRKQLNGLITHCDSPYIRALGFMYIRYVLPPSQLLDWYEPYLDDEEEMDVKAGGGQVMKLGMILRQWMVKLEWFSTLFPRIPVPIQQKIQSVLGERFPIQAVQVATQRDREERKDRHERQERVERREQPPPREAYRDERRAERRGAGAVSGGEKYEKMEKHNRGGGGGGDEMAPRGNNDYRKERSRDERADDEYYNNHKEHKDSSRTREKDDYRERRHRERSPQQYRERSPYREREQQREREPRERERERYGGGDKHHQHAGKDREHRHKRHH